MMGDMSDDQPWAGRFTLGTACGLAGDGESGRLGLLWEGDSERQESLWIRCRSRVRTTSDGESSIDMEPVTLSLDNYESGGRSVHDDIRDCLAGYAKLPTPMPMPMPTYRPPRTNYVSTRLGRRRRPPATSEHQRKPARTGRWHMQGPAQGHRGRGRGWEMESEKSESVLRTLRMA
jgi:hypothetical protein